MSNVPEKRISGDRVWLSLERKVRVEAYESLTVALGASVSLHPGEGVEEGQRRLFSELRGEFADVLDVMREAEGV